MDDETLYYVAYVSDGFPVSGKDCGRCAKLARPCAPAACGHYADAGVDLLAGPYTEERAARWALKLILAGTSPLARTWAMRDVLAAAGGVPAARLVVAPITEAHVAAYNARHHARVPWPPPLHWTTTHPLDVGVEPKGHRPPRPTRSLDPVGMWAEDGAAEVAP